MSINIFLLRQILTKLLTHETIMGDEVLFFCPVILSSLVRFLLSFFSIAQVLKESVVFLMFVCVHVNIFEVKSGVHLIKRASKFVD